IVFVDDEVESFEDAGVVVVCKDVRALTPVQWSMHLSPSCSRPFEERWVMTPKAGPSAPSHRQAACQSLGARATCDSKRTYETAPARAASDGDPGLTVLPRRETT